jgi:hypothetical protein
MGDSEVSPTATKKILPDGLAGGKSARWFDLVKDRPGEATRSHRP